MRVERPWGHWEVLKEADGFKVKRIEVLPHKRLSLQKHKHRMEHWIVLEGEAMVTNKDEIINVYKDESVTIEVGVVHRLENAQGTPLKVLEVQLGQYLEEDDIERLEDDHGRVYNSI